MTPSPLPVSPWQAAQFCAYNCWPSANAFRRRVGSPGAAPPGPTLVHRLRPCVTGDDLNACHTCAGALRLSSVSSRIGVQAQRGPTCRRRFLTRHDLTGMRRVEIEIQRHVQRRCGRDRVCGRARHLDGAAHAPVIRPAPARAIKRVLARLIEDQRRWSSTGRAAHRAPVRRSVPPANPCTTSSEVRRRCSGWPTCAVRSPGVQPPLSAICAWISIASEFDRASTAASGTPITSTITSKSKQCVPLSSDQQSQQAGGDDEAEAHHRQRLQRDGASCLLFSGDAARRDTRPPQTADQHTRLQERHDRHEVRLPCDVGRAKQIPPRPSGSAQRGHR